MPTQTAMAPPAPRPHRPPSPASLAQIALAARSFRIFATEGAAWRAARMARREARRNGDRRGQANDAGEKEEKGEELARICEAVRKALQEDAGGYGAAGGGSVSSMVVDWVWAVFALGGDCAAYRRWVRGFGWDGIVGLRAEKIERVAKPNVQMCGVGMGRASAVGKGRA